MEDEGKKGIYKAAAYAAIFAALLAAVIFITGEDNLHDLIQSAQQTTVSSNNQSDVTNESSESAGTAHTISEASNNAPGDFIPSDVSISIGETYTLIADGIVSGDIIIGDERLFDNEGNTALIVICKKGTIIEAPYGCLVSFDGDLERMIAHVVADGFRQENISIIQWN
jgi:hypothetical protein